MTAILIGARLIALQAIQSISECDVHMLKGIVTVCIYAACLSCEIVLPLLSAPASFKATLEEHKQEQPHPNPDLAARPSGPPPAGEEKKDVPRQRSEPQQDPEENIVRIRRRSNRLRSKSRRKALPRVSRKKP